MSVAYFYMGRDTRGNVARVVDRAEFAYLDHATGAWIQHPRVFDSVTFEADTHEITLAEAKRKAKQLVPNLEPQWIGDE